MIVFVRRAGALLVLMILIVSFLILNLGTSRTVNSDVTQTVVVDAGHGSPDGGAMGTQTKVLEKDLTLAISGLLKAELESRGVKVIMTRTDDFGIHTDTEDSIRNKKRNDLTQRAKIANESGAALLVSIHMNHFSEPKYSGPQIFYSTNAKGSENLAALLRESILETIGSHCTREIKPVTNELFLLREAKIPAVIAECGFLSNPEEELLLSDPTYQQKLAKAIADGIEKYLA